MRTCSAVRPLGSATSRVRRVVRSTSVRAAQAPRGFVAQRPAGPHEQRAVDGLVRHRHLLVTRIVAHQTVGDLLRRPALPKQPLDGAAQPRAARELGGLGPAGAAHRGGVQRTRPGSGPVRRLQRPRARSSTALVRAGRRSCGRTHPPAARARSPRARPPRAAAAIAAGSAAPGHPSAPAAGAPPGPSSSPPRPRARGFLRQRCAAISPGAQRSSAVGRDLIARASSNLPAISPIMAARPERCVDQLKPPETAVCNRDTWLEQRNRVDSGLHYGPCGANNC